MNLLLAEDDALLADALAAQLRRAGFEVEHTRPMARWPNTC
jgi:two-component system OmpR family response regulator